MTVIDSHRIDHVDQSASVLASARQIIETLEPSSDPVQVFTTLAEAVVATGLVHRATVELVDRNTLTRVERSKLTPDTTTTNPDLPLGHTQQLFAGQDRVITTVDSLAVAIHSSAASVGVTTDTGPGFLGSIWCEYIDREPGSSDIAMLGLLVTHAVDVVHRQRTESALRVRIANLECALDTNREIGMAIGVLCVKNDIRPQQAFEQLKNASQNANRKLRDIATDIVASTGPTTNGI